MANAGVRGRPIAPLMLSAQERTYLERQVRRQRVARSLSHPAASLGHARTYAALTNLAEGEFTEGHQLPSRLRVPKAMIGRRLSQEEAKRLLAEFA
jgi:hypothetical protein